jgi:hypothetical protein
MEGMTAHSHASMLCCAIRATLSSLMVCVHAHSCLCLSLCWLRNTENEPLGDAVKHTTLVLTWRRVRTTNFVR